MATTINKYWPARLGMLLVSRPMLGWGEDLLSDPGDQPGLEGWAWRGLGRKGQIEIGT